MLGTLLGGSPELQKTSWAEGMRYEKGFGVAGAVLGGSQELHTGCLADGARMDLAYHRVRWQSGAPEDRLG